MDLLFLSQCRAKTGDRDGVFEGSGISFDVLSLVPTLTCFPLQFRRQRVGSPCVVELLASNHRNPLCASLGRASRRGRSPRILHLVPSNHQRVHDFDKAPLTAIVSSVVNPIVIRTMLDAHQG